MTRRPAPDVVLAVAVRAALVLLACSLSACGQKGPLYLPDQASEIVTRPASLPPEPATDASSPQTVDSPAATDEQGDDKKKQREADQKAKDPAAAPR